MERTNAPKLNPQNRRYASIDVARFFCALLVVAIHVRPLETYTELGNFLLDKGLCRIAVPFFFLVSGFFWARKPMTVKSLSSFLGRILVLYALWTAIYYPIVAECQNMTNYWRRCILSGSYYHLWYYPAMIVAVILTWLFFRNRGGIAVGIAFACYFIGCMGESYYGFFADNEAVTTLAEKYFALFWSTRSGLFFGFFFFALGAYLQKARWTMSRRKAAVALAISFALMAVEILTLRSFGVAKDYNLYFSLIPATLFLFLWLTGRPGDGSEGTKALSPKLCSFCRKSSVLIYGIHLWFKYYGVKWAQGPFVDNSLVQYVVVCLLSLTFAVVIIGLQKVPFLKFLKYLY